jgi:hypothetical protein
MIDLEGIMSTIKVSRNISSFMHITHSINLFLAVVFFALKIRWSSHLQIRPALGRIRNMGRTSPVECKVLFLCLHF